MAQFNRYYPWAIALWISFVFVQSLFFKFTGSPESLYIFQTLEDWSGLSFFEPGLRFAVGFAELVATILLLVPATRWLGAVMALGTMSGAIFFHLFTPLGVSVVNTDGTSDDGTLFFMACTVWVGAAILIWHERATWRRLLPV